MRSFFKENKVWEGTSSATDWEGGGEAALNLGRA